MEDVFDTAWQGRAAAGDHTIEAELASLLDIHGLSLLGKSGQIRRLLLQAFPDQRPRIAAIVGALSAGIPMRLQSAKNEAALPPLLQESAQKLQDQGGLDAASASLAVRAWAYALALPTTGLDEVVVAGGEDLRGVERPRAPQGPLSDVAAPDGRIDADRLATVAAPDPGPSSSRVASVVDQSPAVPPSARREPSLRDRSARTTIHWEPASPEALHSAANSPEPAFTPTAPAAAEAVIPTEPLFADRDPQLIARDALGASASRRLPTEDPPIESRPEPPVAPFIAPGDRDATPAAADEAEPFVPPAWERPTWTPTRSRGRPIVIVGVSVALALAIGLGFVATRPEGDQGSTLPSLARKEAVVPTDPPVPRTESPVRVEVPATTTSDARADDPATRSPVVSATSDDPTVPTATARGTSGPSTMPAASETSPPVQGASPSPPGPPAAPHDRSADTPVGAVANDRGPASRPTIVGVDVPRVVEGVPFAVVLRVAGDARKIAAVERRIVDSGGGWPRGGSASQNASFRRSGATALAVSFRAMDAPAHAIVELTAVDRDGTRSIPAIARIAVAAPPAMRGQNLTAPACAASTCGTVVEARELVADRDARTPLYQIVVRMDDRQTRAFSAPYRLQAGSRVQKSGDRFSPVGTNPQ